MEPCGRDDPGMDDRKKLTIIQQQKADWKDNVLRSDSLPEGIPAYEFKVVKAQPVFRSQYLRKQIKSVTFLDTLSQMPADAWDVSEDGNRSVMAWVKPDGGLYDLYIGAEGGMRTGKSCKQMFAGYVNLRRITFGGVLHTENTEDMSWLFTNCVCLNKLDLRCLDTTGVKDMRCMFYRCTSLAELDLSSFDTTGVKDMYGMFEYCRSLIELDLSSFDTSGVQDMRYMFSFCPAGSKWQHLLH